jgi:PAS domain S-box-containing protein
MDRLFQRRPRARRGALTLVQTFSGLSLLCVLGIVVAACITGGMIFSRHLLEHDAAVVGDLVEGLVTRSLPRSAFTATPATGPDVYAAALDPVVQSTRIVRVILYDAAGTILWSNEGGLAGRALTHRRLRAALAGTLQAQLVRPARTELPGALHAWDRLEEIYVPIRYAADQPVLGVLELYRDPPALVATLSRVRSAGWLLGGGGGLVLWLALLGVVARAARVQAALERELIATNRTLEAKVAERTRDVSRQYDDMKHTKEYLENLIESSADVIVTIGARERVTFASRAVERIFGYAGTAVRGAPVRRFWTRRAGDLRALRRMLVRQGGVQAYETELRAADGRAVPVTVSASLLRDATGQPCAAVAVVTDVTELRKLNVQLVRSERLATAGLLAAGVAHEIGNPVACITSLVEMLSARAGSRPVRRGLADIGEHAARIEKIVEDFTRLARSAPLEFRPHAVAELVDTAITLARHNPVARPLRVTVRLDPDLPPVLVTGARILQVFLNLVLNAAEAGGALLVTATAVDEAVHVRFRDTGVGLAPATLERAFDPFFSTKESTTHMGLGLFVSHEIVRQHGGTMLAESESGQGATFTVVLPAARGAEAAPLLDRASGRRAS